MKIGIIVDGDAESQALKMLTRRIILQGRQIVDPLYANLQPKDAPGQIARSAENALKILLARSVDKIVVLIDRENRRDCPSKFASEIEAAFIKLGHENICVVIKNRKFENWLISDIDVFKKLNGRYRVTASFENSVVPNKADHVEDAEKLINSIALKNIAYHKRRDAQQITSLQDIGSVAENSRSFRRLLRLLEHPLYKDQSKLPKKKK